jgi:hypothetical protein
MHDSGSRVRTRSVLQSIARAVCCVLVSASQIALFSGAASADDGNSTVLTQPIQPSLAPDQIPLICPTSGCLAQYYLSYLQCMYQSTDPAYPYRTPSSDIQQACFRAWSNGYIANCQPASDSSGPSGDGKGLTVTGSAKGNGFCYDGGCSGVAQILFFQCISTIVQPNVSPQNFPYTPGQYAQLMANCTTDYQTAEAKCPSAAKPGPADASEAGSDKPITSVVLGVGK